MASFTPIPDVIKLYRSVSVHKSDFLFENWVANHCEENAAGRYHATILYQASFRRGLTFKNRRLHLLIFRAVRKLKTCGYRTKLREAAVEIETTCLPKTICSLIAVFSVDTN